MRWQLTTGPANEPIMLAEAKDQINILNSDYDAYLTRIIAAARQRAESLSGMRFITQTWTGYLDQWPNIPHLSSADRHSIVSDFDPVQSVTSVNYKDTAGTSQTLTVDTDYTVHIARRGTRISPAFGKTWPTTQASPNSIWVVMVLGYGDETTDVPEEIRHGLLSRVASMWMSREDEVIGASVTQSLLASDRVFASYRNLVA